MGGGPPKPKIVVVTCMDPRLSDLPTDAELNAKFSKLTGDATPAPMRFFAFKDPEQQTKDQIEMVRSHPWISKDVPVRGFVFDVNTGRLREVMVHAEAAS